MAAVITATALYATVGMPRTVHVRRDIWAQR
jgi:hypothetical protein